MAVTVAEIEAVSDLKDGISPKLNAMERRTQAFGGKFMAAFRKVRTGVLAGTAAVGGWTIAMRKAAGAGATLIETSRTVGTTVESWQALQRVFEGDGIAAERLKLAFKQLRIALVELQRGSAEYVEGWSRIGITHAEIADLDFQGVLMRIAEAMAVTDSKTDKIYASTKLFGRAGADMIQVFERGPAAFAASIAEMERLGILTTDEAQRLKDLDQAFTNWGNAASTATGKVASSFADDLRAELDESAVAIGRLGDRWAAYQQWYDRQQKKNQDLAKSNEEVRASLAAYMDEKRDALAALADFELGLYDVDAALMRVEDRNARVDAALATSREAIGATTAKMVADSITIQREADNWNLAFESAVPSPERMRQLVADAVAVIPNTHVLPPPLEPPIRRESEAATETMRTTFQAGVNEVGAILSTGLDLAGQEGMARLVSRISSGVSTALSLLNRIAGFRMPDFGGGGSGIGGIGGALKGVPWGTVGNVAIGAAAAAVAVKTAARLNPFANRGYDAASIERRFPGAGQGGTSRPLDIHVNMDGREVGHVFVERLPDIAHEEGW